MAERKSITRRAIDLGDQPDQHNPIIEVLTNPDFLRSCAKVFAFVGDVLTANEKPSGKVLRSIADAAQNNLASDPVEIARDSTLKFELNTLVTKWSQMKREDDPSAYEEVEAKIKALQERISAGGEHDS